MPELTGIQLLKSLSRAPLVILTTACSEHAINSYELNVVDYLLKPIEYDRFLKAVMKAKELFILKSEHEKREIITDRQDEDAIYIKSGTKTFRIVVDTILYVEGMGNYINFILPDRKIVTYLSMQDVLKLLPPSLFCRIHKSYVVSLKHIDIIEKHQVIIWL